MQETVSQRLFTCSSQGEVLTCFCFYLSESDLVRKSPTFVWEVEMSEVVVYEMSHTGGVITPTSGMEELETEITVPG